MTRVTTGGLIHSSSAGQYIINSLDLGFPLTGMDFKSDGTAVIAVDTLGVFTVDWLTDPENPVILDSIDDPDYLSNIMDITVQGNYAYCMNYLTVSPFTKIVPVDITDPSSISMGTPNAPGGNVCQYITSKPGYVFCCDRFDDRIKSYSISGSTAPVLLQTLTSATDIPSPTGICMLGTNTVVLKCSNRVAFVDVTNPAAMSVLTGSAINTGAGELNNFGQVRYAADLGLVIASNDQVGANINFTVVDVSAFPTTSLAQQYSASVESGTSDGACKSIAYINRRLWAWTRAGTHVFSVDPITHLGDAGFFMDTNRTIVGKAINGFTSGGQSYILNPYDSGVDGFVVLNA